MPVIQTKTTYLQMLAPVDSEMAPPRSDLSVSLVEEPTASFYRDLYRRVGADYYWVDRLSLTDHGLEAIIRDDRVDILLMMLADHPAGYGELDRRVPGEIELAYFGLLPEAIGQGLGKYFLQQTLKHAWSYRPRRVWLHTCDLDHPAALPNYRRAGFEVFEERMIDQWIPAKDTA